jgi:hypothetical protein
MAQVSHATLSAITFIVDPSSFDPLDQIFQLWNWNMGAFINIEHTL